MVASPTNPIDEIKTHPHNFSLPNAELLSIPDEEDEADLEFENPENELPPTDTPIRPWSDFSIAPTKKSPSRAYKFVQLEQALTSANLIKNDNDRIKFRQEYRASIRENKFEDFLQTSYQKLEDLHEEIRRERAIKRSRTFTFDNVETNFLAQDPARNIKIVFIDDPNATSTTKMTYPNSLMHRNSALSAQAELATVEEFYENRSRHLLRNPSRARNEITLFARRAGERLHERFPRLSNVPHRVKIVDQRETKGNLDERTLLQIKHKRTLSLIAKRRQLITKMMAQSQKNQNKMKKLDIRTPLTTNHLLCCSELLERVNQIEQTIKEEQLKRPQTGFISQKTTDYSSSQTTLISESLTPAFSLISNPFQDTLSTHHIEKTNNTHVMLPTRPLTAPIKPMTWGNYC